MGYFINADCYYMEAPPVPLRYTGSRLSRLSSMIASLHSASRVLNVPVFSGTGMAVVLLRSSVYVAPVAEPAKTASNCRYSDDYGQDDENCPE